MLANVVPCLGLNCALALIEKNKTTVLGILGTDYYNLHKIKLVHCQQRKEKTKEVV